MTSSTAAQIIVPVKQTEDLAPKGGGSDKPFPAGATNGTIEDVKVRPLTYLSGKGQDELSKQGYLSDDVEAVSLTIGSTQPLDGQESAGNRKFFTPDIIIRDGDVSIGDDFDGQKAWQLAKSRTALATVANALGATEEVEMENGEKGYAIANGFLEALIDGEYNGQDIGFVVTHKSFKKRDGADATKAEVKTYFQAV